MAKSPARRIALRAFISAVAASAAAALALLGAGSAAAAPQATMSFHHVAGENCPPSGCVVATGVIDAASAQAFAVFVRTTRLQPGALLLLNSQGGDLVQAMKLGLSIRRAGLSTRIQAYDLRTGAAGAGQCTSACAYAFLGGVTRTLGAGGKLGLNQFTAASSRPDQQLPDAQRLLGLVSTYADAMGAASDVAAVGLDTPAGGMHWLSSIELSQYAVVTAA